jgi:hypothetical protein
MHEGRFMSSSAPGQRGRNHGSQSITNHDENPPESAASAQATASLAAYIADMSAELAALAGRSQMPMLAYFLNLARVEAEIRSRESGGCAVKRRG